MVLHYNVFMCFPAIQLDLPVEIDEQELVRLISSINPLTTMVGQIDP